MRTDELRHELERLAGSEPEIVDALRDVRMRVQRRRLVRRVGAVALAVGLIAGAAIITTRGSSSPDRVVVRNPAPTAGDVADFGWTRVPAPPMRIRRVVTAKGHTYAVGSDDTGGTIHELLPDRQTGDSPQLGSGGAATFNDLTVLNGELVAVGRAGSTPAAFALRDGNWVRVKVVQGPGLSNSIHRVVVADGVPYAVGIPEGTSGNLGCPVSVWRADNGPDFVPISGQIPCEGPIDAAAGPAGIVVTTMDNATAWRRSGDEWSPSSMSTEQAARRSRSRAPTTATFAVGSTTRGNDTSGAIWWSPDALTWERVATETSPADPGYRQAQFASVAHTAAGWIAVGVHVHAGHDLRVTDAIVWTSADGRHWSPNTRDNGVFEQFREPTASARQRTGSRSSAKRTCRCPRSRVPTTSSDRTP